MEHNSSSVGKKNTTAKFLILIPTNRRSSIIDDLVSEIKNQIPDYVHAEIIIIQSISETQENGMTPGAINNNSSIFRQQSNLELTSIDKSEPVTYLQNTFAGEKIPAILQAIKSSSCDNVILMSDDFSNPPQLLPTIMESYINNGNCMIIAIPSVRAQLDNGKKNLDGNVISTDLRIVQNEFNPNIKELFSKYVAFPRRLIDNLPVDGKGDTTSLESPLEISGFKILEIPYTIVSDAKPRSKVLSSLVDYAKSILYHYKHGPKSKDNFTNLKYNSSVAFISKAIRFYTVGASGLLINYAVSSILTNGMLLNLWYMEATLIGILASITSNFFLNKAWTFQDMNFSLYYTLRQYLLFLGISCFGALIQLGLVYIGVEGGSRYWTSLLFSIAVASISNFLLNKKFTFNERLWG